MKANLEKISGLERKLSIEIPAEQVKAAFDKVYREIQKSATIKGFRAGKAPIQLIRSTYSDRATQTVIQDLIGSTYVKALEENQLEPISDPKIHTAHFHEDQVFHY